MRLAHLSDDEVQSFLDGQSANQWERQGLPAETDREVREHLESCHQCQAEVQAYHVLYEQLVEPAEVRLSRNFAKNVTWSLPPFAGVRTRGRLEAAIIGAVLASVALVWIAATINWAPLYEASLAWITGVGNDLSILMAAKIASLPSPVALLSDWLAPWRTLVATIKGEIVGGGSSLNLIVVAGITALLLGSLDDLLTAVNSRVVASQESLPRH